MMRIEPDAVAEVKAKGQMMRGDRFRGTMNAPHNRLEVVLETPLLRVTTLGDPDCEGLFLCFTGIRQEMGGIGAEEFVGSTQLPGYSALFVSDLTRSWYNAFPPSLLLGAIQERVSGKRVIALGNSMGGYGAIWISAHLSVDTVIAFAPQYSVHPQVVPEEDRWLEFRCNIQQWRHRSLEGHFRAGTRYYTINGDDDFNQYRHFPHGEGREHLLVKGSGHDPAEMLKAHDVLGGTILRCVRGRSPLAIIRKSGIDADSLSPRTREASPAASPPIV